MATNRIQLKRTFTAGRTPNTTNSANSQYIAAGELALNLADNKLYTSNGSVLVDLTPSGGGGGGSVNTAAQYTFTNTITFSNTITVANISANGTTGSNGNVLMSNGTNLFYANTRLMTIYYANGTIAYTGVDAVSSGGTGSAYVSETAPVDGVANGSMWFYTGDAQLYVYYDDGTSSQWVSAGGAGFGYSLTSNSATFANNASYLNGNTAATLRTYSETMAATAYSNAISYVDSTAATNTYVNSTFQTNAGLSANVVKLTSNNSAYLGGVVAAAYLANTDSKTLSGNLNFTAANNYFSQGFTSNGIVTISYTGSSNSSIVIGGTNTRGGTGYHDFLMARNNGAGVTNPNKWFRLTSTGGLEIINSAYSATLLSLTDAGGFSVSGSISVSGKKAVNGPAFRAYVGTGQTIVQGAQRKVTFDTENFDTDGCFASSTFTPTIEGYYQLNAVVRISGSSSTGEVMLVLYKNGSEYARGTNESGTEQGASFYSMSISDIAYANGTGDYFEVYIQQSSGGDRTTTAGSTISHFSGCMIRGA